MTADTAAVRRALRGHMKAVTGALRALDLAVLERFVELLDRARAEGRTVFVLGNGGSATSASHFACDLGKGARASGQPRFKVLAPGDNLALLTAWANDADYSRVFAEALENFLEPGALVVALSTSGRSANVLRAAETARAHGATVVGLTGRGGGALRELSDLWIGAACEGAGPAEDVHLAICHAATAALRLPCSGSTGRPA